MEAGKRTVSDLFNKGRSLEIPFFQRGYVWEEDNWDRFLDDMQNVSTQGTQYFLGSIILKQGSTGSGSKAGDRRVVIDGQQRLTTILLFFKTLCDVMEEPGLFKDQFFNLAKEVILKHNHNDIKNIQTSISIHITIKSNSVSSNHG